MSGLIESVIGGIPVGTETVKLVWFYVAASTFANLGLQLLFFG